MQTQDLVTRYEQTGHLPVIYLSGPMSGLPDNNFEAFNDIGRKLRLLGFPVLNPADFGHGHHEWGVTAEADHEEWVRCLARDLPLVAAADALVLLPGYKGSQGAVLELSAAYSFDKPAIPAGDGSLTEFLLRFIPEEDFDVVMRADNAAEKLREMIQEEDDVDQVVVLLKVNTDESDVDLSA